MEVCMPTVPVNPGPSYCEYRCDAEQGSGDGGGSRESEWGGWESGNTWGMGRGEYDGVV